MVSNFPLIFLGDTHQYINDFEKQKELVGTFHPEYVLLENLEDIKLTKKEDYDKIISERKVSEMTSFNEVEKLVNLANKEEIKLIGIDFKNFGFSPVLQKKIKNQEELTAAEQDELQKISDAREEEHLKNIKKYLEKSDRPLLVILGCWHLREGGLIRKSLSNYKMIIPCDGDGNIVLGPTVKKEDIKYCEVISDEPKVED